MKFRRRFATRGRLTGFFDALRDRFGPADAWDVGPREETPAGEAATATRASAPGPRPASPPPGSFRVQQTAWLVAVQQRRVLVPAGLFVGALALGYLLAALVFFPAPILATNRAIPRVLGVDEARARQTLQEAGFGVSEVDRQPHPTLPAGAVIWQDPPPEVVAPEATEVALTLSAGPQPVPVPDVAGYDADNARLLIEGAGLRVGSVESTQAPTPRNIAVNTRPPAGTPRPPGSRVVLVVSVGAATIRVPTLTGLTLEEARLALETAGLTLGTTFAQTTGAVAPGEIFYQEPSAGTLSAPGTAVNVRIARSPQ
jgi:serine/threonine-protein kinase